VRFNEGDFPLGNWVSNLRKSQSTLSPERRRRLDALDFEWDPLSQQWEEGFAALEAFHRAHGHCRVPAKFKQGTFGLGAWVSSQRQAQAALSADRRHRLDGMGFDWDPLVHQWEEGFAALEAFHHTHRHCRVPQDFTQGKSAWRVGREAAASALDSFAGTPPPSGCTGIRLDPLVHQWEEGFAALEAFYQAHGHSWVLQGFKQGGFRLGAWVARQRRAPSTLSPDRRHRLDALGFVWDPLMRHWEEGFAALAAFHQTHGHCRVPKKYKQGEFALGTWVSNQRKKGPELSADRRRRLDALALCGQFDSDVIVENAFMGAAIVLVHR